MTAAPISPARRNALAASNTARAGQEVPPGRRTLYTVLALAALVLALGAVTAAYFIGQSSRMSGDAVATRVALALEKRGNRAEEEQRTALSAQANRNRERIAVVRKVSRDRGYKVGKKSGYVVGNEAGYSAGNSAGYSSGHSTGVEEGVTKASDDLTCSDDPDANLPPCFFYDGY